MINNKKTKEYIGYFCAGVILAMLLFGCTTLEQKEPEIKRYVNTVAEIAKIVDPAPGGTGSAVAGLLTSGATGVFAINRLLLARRRGQALAEVHANPDTPSIIDQVSSVAAKKVVAQLAKKTEKKESA